MQEKPQQKNEQYEGASKAVVVMGHTFAYQWGGRLVGAVVGAVTALLNTEKPGKYTEEAGKLLARVNIHSPRTAIALGSAIGGGIIGGWLGLGVGGLRAAKLPDRGREQFERIKSERNNYAAEMNALQGNVDILTQELEQHRHETEHKGFRDQVPSREEAGSHTAAYEAAGAAPEQAALTR